MLNKALLQGRLVADPELRYTPSGVAVSNFRIAAERNVTDDHGERQADFINIVAWRGTAEFVAKYWTKGDMIILEGRIQTRQYTDKQQNKRTAVEVVADHVFFAGGKNKTQSNSDYGGNNYGGYGNSGGFNPDFGTPVSFSDEDLPF